MATAVSPSEGITAGQIGKIQELVSARLRKSGLLSEPVHQALEKSGDAIAEEMVAVVRKHAEATMFLVPRGTHEVTLVESHDPDKCFRTREGLWVYDGFRNLVVAKAKPSKAGETHKVVRAELMQDLTDEKIETSLGGEHFFEETALCAIITDLIDKQPEGKEGVLLNNGYANLFYTVCVVSVRWVSGYRRWDVRTWHRDGRRWLAGDRVFSRN